MNTGALLPKNRLEAFSDGVLAIVITILVLELKVPEGGGADLLSVLGEDWRYFLGYLISFVYVGGFWVSHSNATRLIDRADPLLFRLTLLWLLFVSVIPFTTAVMTEFLGSPGSETAVAIYGIDLFLASLMLTLVIRYSARREGLAADEVADGELEAAVRQRQKVLAIQAVSVLLALFVPELAVGLYLLTAILFLAAPLLIARRARRPGGA